MYSWIKLYLQPPQVFVTPGLVMTLYFVLIYKESL